jgi:hypothetical protein
MQRPAFIPSSLIYTGITLLSVTNPDEDHQETSVLNQFRR